jgi:2-haloacid dehalogenase
MKVSDFRSMTFDCYGTLVDWEDPIGRALVDWARREGIAVKQSELLMLFSQVEWINERARPAPLYPEILRQNLRGIAERLRAVVKPGDTDLLVDAIRTCKPFADTVDALRYFKRFYKMGILSNIDDQTLIKYTVPQLGIDWDIIVTAERVGAYKPDRPHFDRAAELLGDMGVRKSQMLHLGQAVMHDCAASKAYGFGGAIWVDRYRDKPGTGAVLYACEGAEDLRVGCLAELVELHKQERLALAS